jgi:hypothetical protein
MRHEAEAFYARAQGEVDACRDLVARLQFVSSDAESAKPTEEQAYRFADGLGVCAARVATR